MRFKFCFYKISFHWKYILLYKIYNGNKFLLQYKGGKKWNKNMYLLYTLNNENVFWFWFFLPIYYTENMFSLYKNENIFLCQFFFCNLHTTTKLWFHSYLCQIQKKIMILLKTKIQMWGRRRKGRGVEKRGGVILSLYSFYFVLKKFEMKITI